MVRTLQIVSFTPMFFVRVGPPMLTGCSLAPKYDELAKLYTENSDFDSKVTIAKIDATTNDVPEDIQGFPTIKLFPAGAKDAPVNYAGARTVEDLANFVKEHGTHKIDAWVAPAPEADESAAASSSTVAPTEAVSEPPSGSTDEPQAHDEL
jgi:protein disulfide-isomerase A1